MVRDDLPKCEANYAPLTPITFLQRAAAVFPERYSVIYGDRRFNWEQTMDRCLRIASALTSYGISPGDTVVTLGIAFLTFDYVSLSQITTMKLHFHRHID